LCILAAKGVDLLLCAPTGRAAKRMMEASGYEAKTIHRLLEVTVSSAISISSRPWVQVLAGLIASGAVPVVRLTGVFRHAAQSRIITTAHRISAVPDEPRWRWRAITQYRTSSCTQSRPRNSSAPQKRETFKIELLTVGKPISTHFVIE
jgi:hypothetical protein